MVVFDIRKAILDISNSKELFRYKKFRYPK